jgi:hypothetical protein
MPSKPAEEQGSSRGRVSRLVAGKGKPPLGQHALTAKSNFPNLSPAEIRKNSVAPELSGETWGGRTARLVLLVLVDIAKSGAVSTLTYTDLHEKVVARGGYANVGKMTKYHFPLGRVASAMERLKLPPLTSIVVSVSTGLPSSGIDRFIAAHLKLDRKAERILKEDDRLRRRLAEQLWDEVFSYKNWPDVTVQLGITAHPAAADK